VRYEPAQVARLSDGCQPGAVALGTAIRSVWPELHSLSGPYGCWNRRKIAGSSSWSLHAEGRAIDIGVPEIEHDHAWLLACDLVASRVRYGTMRVMWDRHIWSTERRDEWQQLEPTTIPHLDHIHVELFWAAASHPPSSRTQLEQSLRAAR
jgi:hypothetical protein